MKYTCINIQGNLISEEILQKIDKAETQGQLTTDFGFEQASNIRGEIEYAWSRIKLDWKHFSERHQNLPVNDAYGTTLSRKWMEQFFSSIGFELSRQKNSLQGDNNKTYNISHTAENIDQLPIHIVGFVEPNHPDKNTLDVKTSGGTSRFSPHGTMQEYLNVTEHLYGIATNGLFLRLIRDSGRLIKLTYLEFDIKRMLDEDKYSEFTLLFRLIHASRFPNKKEEADQCLLEKYYQDSIETGNRIRNGLSMAVKESLIALGKGFLQHDENMALREKIQSGHLIPKNYYRQLLRIIYRFLFLMVTEERDLIYDHEDKSDAIQRFKKIYFKYYSIARLRKLSESNYLYESQFTDLWQGLVNTFQLFEEGGNGKKLGLQPLAGDLFSYRAIEDLQNSSINNKLLLECVKNLNEFRDENKNLVSINYRSLDVEELGSVYEGLLELHPVIENIEATNPAQINFTFHEGTDRKTTGSYYTSPELVNELIKSALIPVIEERLKENSVSKESQVKALLKLKVCDAAAGSGHMLLAAARTIAWYMARVQSGEDNPAPSLYRSSLREVIQHCIYAVDYNPDAVELCKLALWLEGHNSGKPLSFLDHKIRNGNSLVGVTDLNVLQKGIPEDAYNPVTGDDKQVCQWYKKLAKEENKPRMQISLDFESVNAPEIETTEFAAEYRKIEDLPENSVEETKEKANRFNKLRSNAQWYKDWNACNLWTAAFFNTYTNVDDPYVTTPAKLKTYLKNTAGIDARIISRATSLAMEHKFFHWQIEFPDVFEQGGFDVMLGNPPWEIVELKEQEFFSTRDLSIAEAEDKSERTKLIKELEIINHNLFIDYYSESHYYDSFRKFLKVSGRNHLTAFGRINMYSSFAENYYYLLNKNGRCGIIVPTGLVTDDGNKNFFLQLVNSNSLVSLFDFQNSTKNGKFFQDVHPQYKFSLITLSKNKIRINKLGFYLESVAEILSKEKIFSLVSEDFFKVNPNTKNCPVFRAKSEAEICLKIYKNSTIIINHDLNTNPWNIFLRQGLFNMTSDSKLFRKIDQLAISLKDIHGNVIKYLNEIFLPLYEGKSISIYNHRYASIEINSNNFQRTAVQKFSTYQELENSNFVTLPEFWVSEETVRKFSGENNIKWYVGYKRTTTAVSERTLEMSVIPFVAVGEKISIITFGDTKKNLVPLFIGNLNSLVLDFIAKQKTGYVNLAQFVFEQFPIISPSQYSKLEMLLIIPYVIEITYTSWDIKAFADDVWKEADEDLKAAITKQWEENKSNTGGHKWTPPNWCELDNEGCPLPPFKWDENRRAVLKAELDAIYAKLYGLTTEELRYILDPQDVYGADFPGETFRVLKEKEIRLYGEYRTKRLVLEAWEKFDIKN